MTNLDIGVALVERFRNIAEEDGNVIFRMLGDQGIENGASDVASPASAFLQ